MAKDLYVFHVCEYSRSEYKYQAVKYEYRYKYIASEYKYKYFKFVLEYYSSPSTSNKYYNSAVDCNTSTVAVQVTCPHNLNIRNLTKN